MDQYGEQWIDRRGEYSPAYYAHHGTNGTSEWLAELFGERLDSDAAVLEIGCSVGRHLERLRTAGFTDLTGIEVNERAAAVMADTYPRLATSATVHTDAVESVVQSFDDRAFDAVFSVETLQHLPPDSAWVFEEVARITDLLVTVENEGDGGDVTYINDEFPLYHRDWKQVFTAEGFEQLSVTPGDRHTRRVFRRQ